MSRWGTVIYTNGEMYTGDIIIGVTDGWGIRSHKSYKRRLYFRIPFIVCSETMRSRKKVNVDGVP